MTAPYAAIRSRRFDGLYENQDYGKGNTMVLRLYYSQDMERRHNLLLSREQRRCNGLVATYPE